MLEYAQIKVDRDGNVRFIETREKRENHVSIPESTEVGAINFLANGWGYEVYDIATLPDGTRFVSMRREIRSQI